MAPHVSSREGYQPQRCSRCHGVGTLADKTIEDSREVSGHMFVCSLPACACSACGHVETDEAARAEFVLRAAGLIADAGLSTGRAFRFLRKAVALQGAELAALLDVAPETISRWETEKRPVDRRALALVVALVRDKIQGRSDTLDTLTRLNAPTTLPPACRIDVGVPPPASSAA